MRLPGARRIAPYDDALRRGVLGVVAEMALWEAFGSRDAYLAAPPALIEAVALALEGRGQALADQAKDAANAGGSSGGGAGSGGSLPGGGRATVSRYEP